MPQYITPVVFLTRGGVLLEYADNFRDLKKQLKPNEDLYGYFDNGKIQFAPLIRDEFDFNCYAPQIGKSLTLIGFYAIPKFPR